jgi:putative NADPH-quinone reductase
MQIAIIQGHPDPNGAHYAHALAEAYGAAARDAGREVRVIAVAGLEFPWLRTREDFESGAVAPAIRRAQHTLEWANQLLIIFPLWHGTMPALLKAFFEQTFRPGFSMAHGGAGAAPKRLLKGKSARIVVTMGVPALLYRWYFGAYGVKSLERSILGWSGIAPIRTNFIGSIDDHDAERRRRWLERLRRWGGQGR